MNKQMRAWNKEKNLIPVMIKKYCRHQHKKARKQQEISYKEVCPECQKLIEYALFRLEKCPFKVNKKFCSFCRVHCYLSERREQMKAVMRYSGPRMLFTHPIFSMGHVFQTIQYKKKLKKEEENKHD